MMKNLCRFILLALLASSAALWLALVGLERLYQEEENYSLIEPGLYLGGHLDKPPPGTSAVLNLCEFEGSYSCEVHVWRPIRDAAPAPTLTWLNQQTDFIDAQRNEGRTVFVHCFAGASRSGMVVTAHLMRKHGWTRDDAIARIREKRWQLRPNPAFMELLGAWEKQLASRAP